MSLEKVAKCKPCLVFSLIFFFLVFQRVHMHYIPTHIQHHLNNSMHSFECPNETKGCLWFNFTEQGYCELNFNAGFRIQLIFSVFVIQHVASKFSYKLC